MPLQLETLSFSNQVKSLLILLYACRNSSINTWTQVTDFIIKGFYRVIQGKVEVAKAITKLPFDMICFTGSTATGRLVAMEAAKNLTPCIL